MNLQDSKTWKCLEQNDSLLFRETEAVRITRARGVEKDFTFTPAKIEVKGSLVYTPRGYGNVQEFKKDGTIAVKLDKENTPSFRREDIFFEIPIHAKVVTTAGSIEDRIIHIPTMFSLKDIYDMIEKGFDEDGCVGRIYFNGSELSRSSNNLLDTGIVPNSKMIVLAKGTNRTLTAMRFKSLASGMGYSNRIDGITFKCSVKIRVAGFGIYIPIESTLSGVAKFIKGNDVSGEAVIVQDVNITTSSGDQDSKIYRLNFPRLVVCEAESSYSCMIQISSGRSHYGSSGLVTVDNDGVVFTFSSCTGSTNGTGASSGQIPQIYYIA